VEVKPNVTDEIVEIPVNCNDPMKANDVLFTDRPGAISRYPYCRRRSPSKNTPGEPATELQKSNAKRRAD
jgi:hypothetical protein